MIIDFIRDQIESCQVMSKLGKHNGFITLVDQNDVVTSFGFVNMTPVPYRLMVAYILAYLFQGRDADVAESNEDLFLFWRRLGFNPPLDREIILSNCNELRERFVKTFVKQCADVDADAFRLKCFDYLRDMEYGLEMSLENPIQIPGCFIA